MATARNDKFARVRSVTLGVIKLVPGQPRYLAFLGAMHLGKKVDDTKDPATLARVVDMETGEEGQIICPTVLQKELNEAYPGEAYVGRGFEIVTTKVPEKRYNLVSIVEVSIPEDMAPAIDKMRKQGGVIAAATVAAAPAASAKRGK